MDSSLDPRVKRLPKARQPGEALLKAPLDQFGTYEVFIEPQEGKPFRHEGAVHAPNLEMAFILAKETFSRRFTCSSLCVADTRDVFVSAMTEGSQSAYDTIAETVPEPGTWEPYEIYHLLKRGRQHVHAATVKATSPAHAMVEAKRHFSGKIVFNIWALRTADIRFSTEEEKELWATLPEKTFRSAIAYRGGEKLKTFLDRRRS